MILTDEQMTALAVYEPYFKTAVNGNWARHPGQAALQVIHGVYTGATGDRRRLNASCQSCILHLIKDCGELYYKELAERSTAKPKTRKKKA